ncbi:hypothetical protein [Leptolyngbya sp. 7M]|uniref:hypothetical protein n=1 Tax=Leptolyngbya sp. 7M TaxID=2812896 RepID=UPI001B8C656C|nr:hypothetical protein [Leptolyngbya sp. 7M]QYO66766.1 hypothetical protein JVX88_08170 [Leptolyngbya sp. 7M]
MSSEQQFRRYIDTIRQQIASESKLANSWEELAAALEGLEHWMKLVRKGEMKVWEKLAAALEGLELTYEEMQTQLEAAEAIEERLVEQNQQNRRNLFKKY